MSLRENKAFEVEDCGSMRKCSHSQFEVEDSKANTLQDVLWCGF